MKKVIVAGSREFTDYALLERELDIITSSGYEIEIVSGTAKGADKLGEKYALDNEIALKRMPADWDTYGKRAGYLRNEQMANYADACIVFWDGRSPGTKHMIDIAKRVGIPTKVIYF